MTGVTVRFGPVAALSEASFAAERGAIHALVGENGAGKTTLMRVLFGAQRPDSGRVEVDGRPVAFRSSREAIKAGIGMVSQHYSVIPELTCLQNLTLGAEQGWWLDTRSAAARATELAARMGYEFDWHAPSSGLSPAGSQKLEILKLLWRDSKVMVLDEPTAMLSPADSDALYASLASLAGEGATVVVVTHRLPEVLAHCRTVTVLRAGRTVEARPVGETTTDELAGLIVGHEPPRPVTDRATAGAPMFVVEGLRVRGYRGDEAVKGASLTLHQGEVVGLAGVDGNGQRELFQALVGTRPAQGRIELQGETWVGLRPGARLAAGLRLIPEDRHREGIVEDWTLVENAALGLHRRPPLAKGRLTDGPAKLEHAARVADRFATRHGGLGSAIRSLSGGNQQRFVAGRALAMEPKVVLAFQPTRGLDIDGTAKVYAAVREACRAGACALVVSFDLDELLEQCDRVVAVCGGLVREPRPGLERDRREIGRLMVGVEA